MRDMCGHRSGLAAYDPEEVWLRDQLESTRKSRVRAVRQSVDPWSSGADEYRQFFEVEGDEPQGVMKLRRFGDAD